MGTKRVNTYIHTLFFNVGRKVAAKKADVDLPTVYKKLEMKPN